MVRYIGYYSKQDYIFIKIMEKTYNKKGICFLLLIENIFSRRIATNPIVLLKIIMPYRL